MIILNGLYILALIICCVTWYWVGYQYGRTEERKKWHKDLRVINDKLKEVKDERTLGGLKSTREAYY